MLLIQIGAGIVVAVCLGKFVALLGRAKTRLLTWFQARKNTPCVDGDNSLLISFTLDESIVSALSFAHLAACEIAQLKGEPVLDFKSFCSKEAEKLFYLNQPDLVDGLTALLARERRMAGTFGGAKGIIVIDDPYVIDNPYFSEEDEDEFRG